MSGKVIGWVWDESQSSGSEMLVLLAIAEGANHDGTGSCFSAATVAKMTRLSERTVWRAIKSLLDSGEIEKDGESEKYKTTIYRFPQYQESRGDKLSSPDKHGDRPLTNTTSTPATDGSRYENTYPTTYPAKDSSSDAPLSDEDRKQLEIIDKLTSRLAWWVAKNTGGKEKPVGQRWKQACRRMIELDQRDPREMWHVLNWSQQDEFWQANVQSFDTFRKQYGKLVVKWRLTPANGQTRKLTNAEQALALIQQREQQELESGTQAALLGIESLGTENERERSIESADLHFDVGQPSGVGTDGQNVGAWPSGMDYS
jgi:hypothetical protein